MFVQPPRERGSLFQPAKGGDFSTGLDTEPDGWGIEWPPLGSLSWPRSHAQEARFCFGLIHGPDAWYFWFFRLAFGPVDSRRFFFFAQVDRV